MSPENPSELQASAARMYDYYLGGHHNFPADRAAAEAVIAAFPDMPLVAQANRAFLRRAVRYLVDQGIDQFLDLGSGIPTVGNVHEIAQSMLPEAHVVYVDIDPVAVTHGRALLTNNPHAAVVQADAREPDTIFGSPEARRLLDLSRPLGLLTVALLHFVPNDAAAALIMQQLRAVAPTGSYIAFAHALSEPTVVLTPEGLDQATSVYQHSSSPFAARTRERIARLVEGWELVEPGLVLVPLWRPEGPDDILVDEPERAANLACVGRKAT